MGSKAYQLRKLNQQCQNAIKIKDFMQVIDCYEKMFNYTNDYHYKQNIANIHYKVFNNIVKAAEIYKEIATHLSNESNFWWQYFEIQTNMKKTYNAVSCVYNAINIEINGDRS